MECVEYISLVFAIGFQVAYTQWHECIGIISSSAMHSSFVSKELWKLWFGRKYFMPVSRRHLSYTTADYCCKYCSTGIKTSRVTPFIRKELANVDFENTFLSLYSWTVPGVTSGSIKHKSVSSPLFPCLLGTENIQGVLTWKNPSHKFVLRLWAGLKTKTECTWCFCFNMRSFWTLGQSCLKSVQSRITNHISPKNILYS